MEKDLEQAEDIITLVSEDGEPYNFQVVDVIEVEGQEYALLLPVESGEDEEEDEVLVLRFEDDKFVMIEDDAEFQKVVTYLEEHADDEEEDEEA